MNSLLDRQHTAAPLNAETPLLSRYREVRRQSEQLCAPLEIEDYGIQAAAFASPPKWHLAHTSWFFETMLLKPYLQGYREYNPHFATLFNSYYDTIGEYHPRPERGLLSRPTVRDVYQCRTYIDDHMAQLLNDTDHPDYTDIEIRTRLGLNHEQQHQELFLTDLKYNFAYNPLKPAYTALPAAVQRETAPLQWHTFEGGVQSIGYQGEGFRYDNETPRHKSYVNSYRLASRPVTNAEFMQFIDDGGYQEPDLWLSDAWKVVQQQGWAAPLYWQQEDGEWLYMTLAGMRHVDLNAPASHVSHFEAAAYARWANKRLPTEAEWELAATTVPVEGNFVEAGYLQPVVSSQAGVLQQMFGDVWEWTQSPYIPYPGYKQQHGPLGEYNGKFMSSQMILRGGSCATPENHIRSTYRNFFYPHERWQFSGFRLAEDLE
jgi:ergothioneine biosynthesis protein EgtB